jgi:hypothetical protein
MRTFPFLLLVLLATTAAASTTPELALSAPASTPAAYRQGDLSVASNGADYFAIWRDERSSHEPGVAVSLYGSRIDQAGHLADPFGILIAKNVYRASLASNGHGYLIAYSPYSAGTFLQKISDDGRTFTTPARVSDLFIVSLVANGNGYGALVSDAGQQTFKALFFDAEGLPAGEADLGVRRDPVLIVSGGDYRLVDLQWTCDGVHECVVHPRMTSLGSAGPAGRETIFAAAVSQWTRVNAVAAGDRIVIAMISDGSPALTPAFHEVTYLVTDASGNIVVPPNKIASSPAACICGSWRPSLVWDGSEVLIAFPRMRTDDGLEGNSKMSAIRVRPDGTVVDAQPFDITNNVSTELAGATGSNGVLLVTTEQHVFANSYYFTPSDIDVRRADSLRAIVSTPAITDVVQSAPVQLDSAVVASGSRALVAWREGDQSSSIKATLVDSMTMTAGPAITLDETSGAPQTGPAIALVGEVALITWRAESAANVRILGKRVRMDGSVIDSTPIVIADQAAGYPPSGMTSVASDGAEFFVVWDLGQEVYGARVQPNGTLMDSTPITVSRDSVQSYHQRVNPRVTWSGSAFVAVWGDAPNTSLLISPPLPPYTVVRLARVTPTGVVLDSTDSRTLFNRLGPIAEPDIAFAGDHGMAVWSLTGSPDGTTRCNYALPLDPQGLPTATTPQPFGCEALTKSTDVVARVRLSAKDDTFAAVWTSNANADVRAALLTRDGSSSAPFVVSPAGQDAWGAAVAAVPDGLLVTYSRIAMDSQYGGVARLFARTIEAPAPGPRQRAARH